MADTSIKAAWKRVWTREFWAVLRPAWPDKREFWAGFWPAIAATFVGAILAIWVGLQVTKHDRETDRQEKEDSVLPKLFCELDSNTAPLNNIAKRDAHPTSRIRYRALKVTMWDAGLNTQLIQAVQGNELIFDIARAYSLIGEVNDYIVRYQDFDCSASTEFPQGSRCAELMIFLRSASSDASRNVVYAMEQIKKKIGDYTCLEAP
jgi:hypothetical protein